MNKTDLIELVSKVTCAKKEARDAVNSVFDSIKKALNNGDKVVISGLGTFNIRYRKARTIKNPLNGEITHIKARRIVKFKPADNIIKDGR